MTEIDSQACWLCHRPLGARVEWHHPVPKSKGGRETVSLHPICHRTLHATFDNKALERLGDDRQAIISKPEMIRFLAFIANKDPDFHVPTHGRR